RRPPAIHRSRRIRPSSLTPTTRRHLTPRRLKNRPPLLERLTQPRLAPKSAQGSAAHSYHMTSESQIAADIAQHGWSCMNVYDGDPQFLYTVGLIESFNHPELVIFGLESSVAHSIALNVISKIRAGANFCASTTYSDILMGDQKIAVRQVHPTQHPL